MTFHIISCSDEIWEPLWAGGESVRLNLSMPDCKWSCGFAQYQKISDGGTYIGLKLFPSVSADARGTKLQNYLCCFKTSSRPSNCGNKDGNSFRPSGESIDGHYQVNISVWRCSRTNNIDANLIKMDIRRNKGTGGQRYVSVQFISLTSWALFYPHTGTLVHGRPDALRSKQSQTDCKTWARKSAYCIEHEKSTSRWHCW